MLAAIEHGFLPSGKYIYNHDIMDYTAENVVENKYHSAQALGITESWDRIQLHPDLKPLWNGIRNHYKRIKLTHSSQVIWELDRKHLGIQKGYEPSVCFYGQNEHLYWGDKQWFSVVNSIILKNKFYTLAKELDVLVPKTQCYDSVIDININALNHINFPCFFKSVVSSEYIYRCEVKSDLILAMQKIPNNIPVQIQEEVKAERFITLQYRITETDVIRLIAAENIQDGLIYKRGCVPASHEPWRMVDTLAYLLKEMGMQGIICFNMAVVQTKHGLRFPLIKCTPRYKDITYSSLIAQKLNIPQWCTVTLATRFRSIEEIDIKDIEYNCNTGEGAIIVNWGSIIHGKLTYMLSGETEYQEILANELKARLK